MIYTRKNFNFLNRIGSEAESAGAGIRDETTRWTGVSEEFTHGIRSEFLADLLRPV